VKQNVSPVVIAIVVIVAIVAIGIIYKMTMGKSSTPQPAEGMVPQAGGYGQGMPQGGMPGGGAGGSSAPMQPGRGPAPSR